MLSTVIDRGVDRRGELGRNGRAMSRLITAAILLIVLAAPAWAGLGEGLAAYKRGDYATAMREFRTLAAQGNARAQYNLGVMYRKGHGVPQDHVEAIRWLRKAAEQGLTPAQHGLGVMYSKGHGVPQDYAEAMRWWRKAAEQGIDGAQYNLGIMYGYGQGVQQDYVQAHMWFDLAATQGNKDAAKNRDLVAKLMTPANITEAQRLAREWMAKYREARGKKQ